ncbi:hypothetical protein [Arthrobacter bambusae]|uniref:hypothetical protein n=1 Tax=Arthrobacter bambusae TaxID=1338426 RepID=UPI0027845C81|nr:hypothetical protein [Arthrobacter bambusae]MDQ0241209.1 hypothetical protein [Arthrobacter bambusae]
MSREGAAAKAVFEYDNEHAPSLKFEDADESSRSYYLTAQSKALAAADAHDAAHGIHRVGLDDATVERAARVLIEDGQFGVPWDDAFDRERAETMDLARSVLAAAVEADHE